MLYVQEEKCCHSTQSRMLTGIDFNFRTYEEGLEAAINKVDELELKDDKAEYEKSIKEYKVKGMIFKLKGRKKRKRQIYKLLTYKKVDFIDFLRY